jgi:hypothetical protein
MRNKSFRLALCRPLVMHLKTGLRRTEFTLEHIVKQAAVLIDRNFYIQRLREASEIVVWGMARVRCSGGNRSGDLSEYQREDRTMNYWRQTAPFHRAPMCVRRCRTRLPLASK